MAGRSAPWLSRFVANPLSVKQVLVGQRSPLTSETIDAAITISFRCRMFLMLLGMLDTGIQCKVQPSRLNEQAIDPADGNKLTIITLRRALHHRKIAA